MTSDTINCCDPIMTRHRQVGFGPWSGLLIESGRTEGNEKQLC